MKNAAERTVCDCSSLTEIGLEAARRVELGGCKNVQKKNNNLLTGIWIFAILDAHTVNT